MPEMERQSFLNNTVLYKQSYVVFLLQIMNCKDITCLKQNL